ncbi:MAG TPA: substrate-binding domain-containing protein [Terriglobales bacterium]|nr:substrate-binding domain-containing protein [Terriglobales bacterium]
MKTSHVILSVLFICLILGGGAFAYYYYTQSGASSSVVSTTASVQTTMQSSMVSATQSGPPASLVLSTTTSTVDSGLLDYLLPYFESQYNVQVKVLSLGTGQALTVASHGDADVVLVHSRKLELPFVAAGYGVHRVGVMYNDFIIVGPTTDPAGIAGTSNATAAFLKIEQTAQQGISGVVFISRADKSGTNTEELSIWSSIGITPSNKTYKWYVEAGAGMGTVLQMANQLKAYTLTDRATWLHFQSQLTNLIIMTQGSKNLLNPYAVIPVNATMWPNRNYQMALTFAKFLISPQGQDLIGNYTVEGKPTFIPIARNITAANALGFPDQAKELAWYDSVNPANMASTTAATGVIVLATKYEDWLVN